MSQYLSPPASRPWRGVRTSGSSSLPKGVPAGSTKQEVPTGRLKDILASATVLAWRQPCSLSMSQCLHVASSCSPALESLPRDSLPGT